MADNKVKISNILESQFPEFILDDNPLFKEFLEQYYLSQEHEYGTVDLATRIDDLKDISTFKDLPFIFSAPITSEVVYNIDDVINVSNTAGFPNQYGLIKIGNEIITYTGKTATSFTGCVRGFSGIDALSGGDNPEFLNFNVSNTEIHAQGSIVTNLGLVFLAEFYKKYKTLFLPGFEERQFQNVNIDNILSRARDFYSSKGTDSSLKILFSVLYGKYVEIVKPFDNTIQASTADWALSDIIVVESIEGNPGKLQSTTVLQGSFTNPTAKGAVARVEEIFLNRKKFYKIFFSRGSVENAINTSKKTKVLGVGITNSTVTVDSTLGFPESGTFFNKGAQLRYSEVTYTYKNANQFFGCVGLSTTLVEGDSIIDSTFLYGYEDNDTQKPVQMRVVGTLVGLAKNSDTSSQFKDGDRLHIKHLGEKVDHQNPKFNKWFYNNVTYTNVASNTANSLTTEVDHYLHIGDRVDILLKRTKNVEVENVEVSAVNSSVQFSIGSGTLDPAKDYIVRKRLKFASTNLSSEGVLADIQNTFVDKDKNTYVAFTGLPGYSTVDLTDRSKTYAFGDIDDAANSINITSHGFESGEGVFHETTNGEIGITTGTYFVNVVDVDNIQLGVSRADVSNNIFIGINTTTSGDYKLTPSSLHGKQLVTQNNFKRIYKTPKPAKSNKEITGPIGVALNGLELYSPVSEDSIFFGQIDTLNILNSGRGYDVINSPEIGVTDDNGTGATVHGNFVGKIEDITITNQGFDYTETPMVTIHGGNGTEATAEARMRGLTYEVSFTDFEINLGGDFIELPNGHRFLDNEEVTYLATGTPIGIGSTAVGFTTSRMTSGATYFLKKLSNTQFQIHPSKNDVMSGINTVDFNSNGNKQHTFRSKMIRTVIDRIVVTSSTDDFSNKKVIVDGVAWPPVEQKNLYSSFVGINTADNYIYARNHSFKNGDNVIYSFDGTAIGGLTANSNYKVTVLDNDRFMLSDAGTATTISSVDYDRKVYTDLTSVGVGTHTFKYPDISVSIDGLVSVGKTTMIPSYYKGTATPVVRGSLDSVFIRNGGSGYGVSDMINFQKSPRVKVKTGSKAEIRVIIADGKIVNAFIANSGSEYTSPPNIKVVGEGKMGELTTTIVNGEISTVTIVNAGSGYKEGTVVEIIPTGIDAKINAEVHEWKINNIERYSTQLDVTLNRDMVQIKAPLTINENKLVGFYPGKRYRQILDDNVKETGGNIVELHPVDDASLFKHSPILGWAYDGNPIYGAYGNANAFEINGSFGGVKRLTSSYDKDLETNNKLRPSGFNDGFFIQDWVYEAKGDLDEYNGRYCQTPDFPDGTYAYFAPITDTGDVAYPYITKIHYNESDEFNYDILVDQSDTRMNSGLYKRNVTHLGLNEPSRNYPFLEDPLNSKTRIDVNQLRSAKIDSITVETPGENYQVGQQVNFNEDSIDAEIGEILGKNIRSITSTETEFRNTIFSVKDNVITGITTIPHGFLDTDTIEITGISSASYKNIEGFRAVGVSTVNTQLSVAMPVKTTSGITTDIQLTDTTSTKKFVPGDVIQIGNEQMLIAHVDEVNNKYRVTREFNGTTSSAHAADVLVSKRPIEFTFNIDTKLENKNIEFAHKQNFGIVAVGVGSTATNVPVGKQGDKVVNISIPARSIYLPGHKFQTGEQLTLVSVGGTIKASSTAALDNIFDLSDVNLFAVRVGTDFLGIATSKVFSGITSSVFFVGNDLEGKDHTLTQVKNNITGIAKKVSAQVVLESDHSMKVGDEVKLNVTTSRTQRFRFKYNDQLKKLVVDPQTFVGTAVSSTTNEITIPNHGLETGDIVAYINAVGVATPLQNNQEYYVIKINEDTIKLADSMYSATAFPYENINITEQGHGTHEISLINPKLEITSGGKVSIGVSDTSLSGYDINFYTDDKFNARYESTLITRGGTIGDGGSAEIDIEVDSNLPNNLFYRIEGDDLNYTDTYPSSVNESVNYYSNIVVVDSKYNQNYKLTSVGSTTFDFTLVGAAETTLYTSSGFSSAFYSTTSKNDFGGIHSIDVINPGINIRKLPTITSIGSTIGKNALLNVNASDIGEIKDSTVVDTGIEFLEDLTLAPKVDTNIVLELKNTLVLDSIGVTTSGVNYTVAPTVFVIGNNTINAKAILQGSSVSNVDVLETDSNLNEDLKVIAINNSNGVRIIGATSNDKSNVLRLRAPVSGFINFPFEVGDEIFVENVQITDSATADGYNSSDYDYQYFTVTARNTTGGLESITYSIAGIGLTGGTYNSKSNAAFGRVIKASDLATFEPRFKKVKFEESEKISLDSNLGVFGTVARNGWDSDSGVLKLTNITGEFKKDNVIRGRIGDFKSTISRVTEFDFDARVGSTSQDYGVWHDDIGKLSFDLQRLHDNDYYQRFSYAIRGEVPLDTWKEAVDSLDHTAGYKNFSDFEIITYPPAPMGNDEIETDIDLTVELSSNASVWCRLFYDTASEDTDSSSLSKIIIFDNKVITDYNESRTNKVLMIDDISPQFTGVGNSSGQLVGLSTFNIFNKGNTLLYHTVNPVTGIETHNSLKQGVITIKDHEFNTGEKLTYDPTNNGETNNNGTHLGIVTTSSGGIGLAATDLLPEEVFAIRIDEDTFSVAVGKSEAVAGLGVTFVNAVGIGTTHSFATESDLATTRAIITIDNIVQSPIGRKDVTIGLTTAVGIGSTQITVNDVDNVQGNTIIKINDELLKVTRVGVGSTNVLNILRGQLGTVAGIHTEGASTNVMSGDYRINHGTLHFTDPPYGPAGIGSLTTNSTFSGRVFYRLDYTKNLIMDDVSEEFGDRVNGNLKSRFNIKHNGIGVSGINTSFGAVLVNNIFQKPFYGDVGSILESDYRVIGTGETISFTGTNREDLPKGGIINEFSVGVGSNYQVPRRAIGVAIVNGSGNITNVNIGGTSGEGAGYLFAPNVSIADTLGNGTGAAVTATVGAAGTITEFTVNNGGTNYTQASPPLVFVDEPSPYKNLNMVGGQGVGAKMDVVVGTGGSIIDFKIADRGLGYKVGDVLSLQGLPFNPVGVGSTAFQITVVNKYQNKFAGWTFGQLLELDDFSNQFNGSRNSFLITRTIVDTEYYSIIAKEGSGIVLANNLLVFLNDVLQKPRIDYEFTGGTRITFNEAPKAGSKFKIYLYVGSEEDYVSIDVDETIKPGDRLRLQTQDNIPSQDQRVIYELIASDTVETETYSGIGIVTDPSFKRPVEWCKQTSDLIIDGQPISKERNYLEPKYNPSTNIISSIGSTDTKFYVNNAWNFSRVDDLGQTLNDVRITSQDVTELAFATASVSGTGTIDGITVTDGGFGYKSAPQVSISPPPSGTTATGTATITNGTVTSVTITDAGTGYASTNPPTVMIEPEPPVVEKFESVTYSGDYGVIVAIGGSPTGIDTTSPKLEFYLRPDSAIWDPTPNSRQISRSGISTGDLIVIRNTQIGSGVTSIDKHVDDIICTSSNNIDNVYKVHQVISIGSSDVRISCNVDSLTGINTDASTHTDSFSFGEYSFGIINTSGRPTGGGDTFTFHNTTGIAGIETSAHVSRLLPLRLAY